MSASISLLIVDDQSLVRDMLAGRLGREPDMEVVGSASNAREAIERATELGPDVVLLDIDMPGLASFEAARTICERCRKTRILFLSSFFHDRYIEEALQAGASGYLTKNDPPESLIAAIRKVSQGSTCFSPEVESRLAERRSSAWLASSSVGARPWRTPQHSRTPARPQARHPRCSRRGRAR